MDNARLADDLAAYDPANDPKFKKYADFITLRNKLVKEIRDQDPNALQDSGLLTLYKVRVCK